MSTEIRVLWTVNVVLPAVAERFRCAVLPFGGWIPAMIAQLARTPGIRVGVAMRAPVRKLASVEEGGVTYYAVPQQVRDQFDVSQQDCASVLEQFAPDLLHAEGSEMAYTRRFMRTWRGPSLLSLQGVINGYEPYELGRLPLGSMLRSLDARQMLVAAALLAQKRLRFEPRLAKERETIALASHLMGRTLWDRAQAQALNPGATYFTCHRILRAPFGQRKWRLEGVERHSLFVGNAGTAKKGAHFAVAAVAQLRREYPDIRLRIAGTPPPQGWSPKALVGYQSYLTRLVRELDLEGHVEFVGLLSAAQMAERMERTHVFVLPSLIENSPNTLGEAMMTGVPCVAAYAGGVPSMSTDGQDALHYRADDARMLAYQIKRLFDDDALACRLSASGAARARATHDPDANLQALLAAYRSIFATRSAARSETQSVAQGGAG